MFSMAMWMAALVAPIQIVAGDLHGLNTLEHQPAKIAAMEGHWETRRGAPLILFGWPDMAAETTRYAVEIPKLGSLILTHRLERRGEGPQGLAAAASGPTSLIVFWSFRIMVGIGVLMLLVGLWSLRAALARAPLRQPRCCLRFAVLMGPSGFVAVLAGWITTEVGRQPYTVYGLLRTADSVSPIDAAGRRRLARRLHHRLLRRVRRRHLLHPAPDAHSRPTSTSRTSSRACRCAPPASRPRRRSPHTPHGKQEAAHALRSRLHLGRPHRLRRARLRAARRLRPRRRHPVPVPRRPSATATRR